MKKIGIVGYGYVGKGMFNMFKGKYDLKVYDPYQFMSDSAAILDCDLVLICVPTPRSADGSVDASIVEESVRLFRDAKLICIKSTVPPGTTERLIVRYGRHIHFSPEYMGEGSNYVEAKYPNPVDARSHPFCIVGGDRAHEVLDFFRGVMATSARYVATNSTDAELAKYMENAYLAMKVAFCNEFARICSVVGSDYNDVRDIWLNDPRVDPSHTLVFKEQRGFDGKCLPKDLSGIRSFAKSKGVDTPVLDGIAHYDMSAFVEAPKQAELFVVEG